MPQRPILLFDVMDTLVFEPYFTVLPRFFGLTLEQLREQRHPTSWIDFEYGRLSEEEYFECYFADGRKVDGEALRRAVLDSYDWLDGMETLLADLHAAGFEIHALSNYPVWYRMIEEKLQLSRYLQWTFVSCLTGIRKPDPQAYLSAAEHRQVSPSQLLLVDDRQVNIDAALATGLDAILMQDARQVRRELEYRAIRFPAS